MKNITIENMIRIIIMLCVVQVLTINVNASQTEKPSSLPLEGVFQIPKGADSYIDKATNSVVITDDKQGQIGSIFSTNTWKMNLTKDFKSVMYIKIGTYGDFAADGVTFVMHNDPGKANIYSAESGESMGVYAPMQDYFDTSINRKQLNNSFTVEFDTYYNGIASDNEVLDMNDYGHIAYSFPDQESSYRLDLSERIQSINHKELQYPNEALANRKWQKFTIDWKAEKFGSGGNGTLEYQFENLPKIKVPIPYTTFNANSVFWGFTGATGSMSEKAEVIFNEIPGAIELDETMEIRRKSNNELVTSNDITVADEELKVKYTAVYKGGIEDEMKKAVPTFVLDRDSIYAGNLKLNGKPFEGTISKGVLKVVSLENLSNLKPKMTVEYDIVNDGYTGISKAQLGYQMISDNYISEKLFNSYQVDAEKPTAKGNVNVFELNDYNVILEEKDLKKFMRNIKGSGELTAKLKDTSAEIKDKMSKLGPSSFTITLSSSNGKKTDILIPMYVKKASETVNYNNGGVLVGEDFKINILDYPVSNTTLTAMLKQNISYFKLEASGLLEKSDDFDVPLTGLPKPNSDLSGEVGNKYEVKSSTTNSEGNIKLSVFMELEGQKDGFDLEKTVTKGGKTADEVFLGDRLTYQLSLTSKLSEITPSMYYDQLTIESSEVSSFLEKVTNLKLTRKDGSKVGTVSYDNSKKKVVGKIVTADKIKASEDLILSYEATVQDKAPLESIIKMSGAAEGTLASGLVLAEKISNEVHSTIKNGGLMIHTYPEALSFGKLFISAEQKDYPVSSMENELGVQDRRGIGNSWKMTAKLLTDLTDKENNRELTDVIYYKYGNNTPQVMKKNISVIVSENKTISSEPVVLSNEWTNKDNPTLLLKLQGGKAKVGNYSGDIQWSLEDVPLNKIKE